VVRYVRDTTSARTDDKIALDRSRSGARDVDLDRAFATHHYNARVMRSTFTVAVLLAFATSAVACAHEPKPATAPRATVEAPVATPAGAMSPEAEAAKQNLYGLARSLVSVPPAPGSQNLPPRLLEGNRVAGTKSVVPDDATKVAIAMAGRDKIIGSFKLCIGVDGVVKHVTLLRTTEFAAYDEKILREMRAWQYSPYRVNGNAVPVCTAVTFIYRQPLPAPPRR